MEQGEERGKKKTENPNRVNHKEDIENRTNRQEGDKKSKSKEGKRRGR